MQTTDELFLLLTRDDGRSESQGAIISAAIIPSVIATTTSTT